MNIKQDNKQSETNIDKPAIVWLRNDLRVADNPALYYACENEQQVIVIYIISSQNSLGRDLGSASMWWLQNTLAGLNTKLSNKLLILEGDEEEVIYKLAAQVRAKKVYWNRRYEPENIEVDTNIKKNLKAANYEVDSFAASLLREPHKMLKDNGDPYKVFTPFFKKNYNANVFSCNNILPEANLDNIINPNDHLQGQCKTSLLSGYPWWKKLSSHWLVGEDSANHKLTSFIEHKSQSYKKNRDFPSIAGISKLSPHLHFGEISPRKIWHDLSLYLAADQQSDIQDVHPFLRQLVWRDFSYYLIYHFPNFSTSNFQPSFDAFPWQDNPNNLDKWQKGQTGYPIVDAAMRELWQTGYMHNRTRMVVASFLVKNLLIHWRHGEQWFWNTLVDADLANNCAGWQWVAGCGADAAPYFRVFNPVLQGKKFDPDGEYVRQYVPEIANLPNSLIHCPWDAPTSLLKQCGINLGKDYPLPIVDLAKSRNAALEAFQTMKQLSQ